MNINRCFVNGCFAVLVLLLPFVTANASQNLKIRSVDKVELLSIEYQKGYIEKIIDTKGFEGKEAQAILAVWKRQKLGGPSPSACHQPGYAMKFYSKGKLVMFGTICWGCRNIDFLVPRMKHWVRFQANSRDGQRLKNLFMTAFSNEQKMISRAATEQ